jgi:hypothetical protein
MVDLNEPLIVVRETRTTADDMICPLLIAYCPLLIAYCQLNYLCPSLNFSNHV